MSEPVWGVLTRAAARLDELAAHWAGFEAGFAEQQAEGGTRWDSPLDMWLYDAVESLAAPGARDWIATMSPVVAAPLAAWLRAMSSWTEAAYAPKGWSEAVEFARLVLNEGGDGRA